MTVIERIDRLRIERGWSVNNLAMNAMLTQSTLNNLYLRKAEPKLSTLRAVCSAFGITLTEFFAGMEGIEAEEGDEKLMRLVSGLSDEQKSALTVLLEAVKR